MKNSLLLVGIILVAGLTRLVPHPANFTPITAMALASGAYFGRKSLGVLAPVAALFISDLIIGVYPGMFLNYLTMILIALIGSEYCRNLRVKEIVGSTVLGSVLFFSISNFGVWYFSNLYEKDFSGLISCYINAIPFFGNTLAGDLTYSTVIFLAAHFATSHMKVKAS
ncbi:MAG: hypothetical protein A4S09_11380 [Proteobacteria bacterium SG_bin7]|nr:MAG: hypothetical protein A4S09_11380 [Proteobacteria bacterium SG_bin7]